MRRSAFLLAIGFFASAAFVPAGCAVETGADRSLVGGPGTGETIIGGTADTTNKAVMWVTNDFGASCSGTMIAKNGNIGYVLTAAHCGDQNMQYVVQADDFSDCFGMGNPGCEAVYGVTQTHTHPNWNGDPGNGYDFSILIVSGVGASTPVIPAAPNPDGVSVGTPMEVVGYGQTFSGDQSNTLRRHVTETVAQIYGNPPILEASQTDGTGSCQGDSGGPGIAGGQVVGVTSFGDFGCDEFGGYGRVQAVYNTWIAGIIGAPVEPSCDACFDAATQQSGACSAQVDACLAAQSCLDFIDCIEPCGSNACYEACINANQAGADLYIAIVDCACTACATECAMECQGGTSSAAVTSAQASTSAGPTSTSATGGGGAPTGGGDEDDDGQGGSNGSDDDDGDTVTTCTCSAPGAPSTMSGAFAGLGALGLALALRGRGPRRRRG